MKISFLISGTVLNENETGLEASLHIYGYENDVGYMNTDKEGKFVLKISKIPFIDSLFKKSLIINPRISENKYGQGIGYNFRIWPNRHIKLKIYPFSNRVVEIK